MAFQNEHSFNNYHKQLDLKQHIYQTYEKQWFNQNHRINQFKIVHRLYVLFRKYLSDL